MVQEGPREQQGGEVSRSRRPAGSGDGPGHGGRRIAGRLDHDGHRLTSDETPADPGSAGSLPAVRHPGYNPGEKFFSGDVRSPIRAHTSGAAQSTQLYLSQLVRSMGETPRSRGRSSSLTAVTMLHGRRRGRSQPLPRRNPSADPAGAAPSGRRCEHHRPRVALEPLTAAEQAAFRTFKLPIPRSSGYPRAGLRAD